MKKNNDSTQYPSSAKETFDKSFQPLLEAKSSEEKYKLLLNLGKELSSFPEEEKKQENLVSGCQSITYLYAEKKNDSLIFLATSNALVSSGIARLLTLYFSEKPAEQILQDSASFLDQLNLKSILSPSRANGLDSMILKIKQSAVKFLL